MLDITTDTWLYELSIHNLYITWIINTRLSYLQIWYHLKISISQNGNHTKHWLMEKIDNLMFDLKYHLPWSSSKLGLARVHTRTFNTYSTVLHVMLFIIPTITFSIGHDLALMSLCNHTILSHGTFSYWSGYFAGGLVIRPEHFNQYRYEYYLVQFHLQKLRCKQISYVKDIY